MIETVGTELENKKTHSSYGFARPQKYQLCQVNQVAEVVM